MSDKKIIALKVQMDGEDATGKISDGYHTFDELYDHRIELFIALCSTMTGFIVDCGDYAGVWRSKLHHDGSGIEGWFIMGINKDKGNQISYHIPIDRWEDTNFAETLDRAPEWDGHTPKDVLERLKNLYI